MRRAVVCVMLFACGDDASSVPPDATVDAAGDASVEQPSSGCGTATGLPLGTTTVQSMTFGGRERTWRVRLPATYDGSPRPIMFVLHGGFGTAEQIQTRQAGFDPIAEREGAIVVYPNGIAANESATNPLVRAQTWNGGACCGPAVTENVDDVGFLTAVLDRVEAEACVDKRRVFFTGMSNGGIMSYRMACEAADRVTAIAPVAGTLQLATCSPSRKVPLFAVHGTLDASVLFDGGTGCGPGMVMTRPIPEIVTEWAGRNACSGASSTVLAEGDATCVSSGTCDAETVLCSVELGDHSWPSSPTAPAGGCGTLGGRQSTTFRAGEAIWAFFARQ
ncbi:MAG: alpha/beta hydrolase family esterase [Kofleriaceae bacterium]